ncbi:MAG: hypothetical protein OHK0013_21940 [Sandaracinaceae bacterium]
MPSRALALLPLVLALVALASPQTAVAQTMIPGGNTGTTTWTLAGSPYVVAGDLTVQAGAVLTIEQGVVVRFATTDALASGTDTARVELTVRGTLVVNGTPASPVTFQSASGSSPGSWVGIILESTATSATISSAVIEHAVTGLRSSLGGTTLNLSGSTFQRSNTGLLLAAGTPVMDRLTATGCVDGIVVQGTAAPTFTNALVTGSTNRGFRVQAATGTTTVENATIVGGADCIYATSNLTVTDSIITGCTDDGIDLDGGAASVTYSNVWGNGTNYEGVSAGTGTLSANPLFVGGTNYRLTSNSPSRFSGSTGDDQGALPYVSDATPGTYGTLWVDTTLPAGNTVVAGDLTVAPGVTLTLSPGATLTFATTDIMAAYADVARAELRVFGTLRAVGSTASPITLTSSGSTAGAWVGVSLEASATGSALDRVLIDEAVTGLRHASTAPQSIVRVTVERSNTGLHFSTTPMTVDAVRTTGCVDGILVQGTAAPTFTNALVTGSTNRGFRVQAATGTTTIHSTTISGGSDCIYATSNLSVVNAIITGCTDDGIDLDGGAASVTYSNVWGNGTNYEGVSAGMGCISANPLFVGSGDFRLTASSVCIDAGTASGAPSTDHAGVARPLDGDGVGGSAHDMGAYEYVRAMICGDGVVTAPEVCDDGAANGMYGRCNATCTGLGERCGDGVRNGPEACDDGNTSNTDACLNTCVAASCGDGFAQAGVEACDDGNAITTDGCILCMVATCGDGYVRAGVEACDDGNTSNTDACVMCANAFCGDGYVRAGVEACDDGNTSNTDACLNSCMLARCGDGFVGPGESCDDGNTMDGDGCSSTCRTAACGDGRLDAGEECDDGNMVNDDMCSNACRAARCGDGIRHSGEECDDGNMVDDDMCSNACRTARCGDGIRHAGEECDDGNTVPSDACTASCTVARCGDGVVRAGVEECDDGNGSNTDACVAGCVAAACGDGFVRAGVEACDDGNTTDGDGCSATCALASCGDGIVQPGEACDDGNGSNTDACLNTCLAASCGDGYRHVGVEACDDGNADDTDACLATCEAARCGDGFVQDGVETCDDGNDLPGDGCNASCMSEPGGPDAGMSVPDAGTADSDTGTGADDAGSLDGGLTAPDAGPTSTPPGCGCRTTSTPGRMPLALVLFGLALALRARRRRA